MDASEVCILGRFDESRKAGLPARWLVERRDGSRVTVSPSAKVLIDLCKSGHSDEQIAQLLHKPESAVRAALKQLEEVMNRTHLRRADSFWFQLTIISSTWVQRLVSSLRLLYRPWFAIVSVAVSALIIGGYLATAPRAIGDTSSLLIAALLFFASLIGHELGHAAACAAMGATPSAIGLTVYIVYPALFSDVSDAWRLSRFRRCVVDIGGLYFQAICMAGLTVCYWVTRYDALRLACWLNLASMSFSLNPLLKMDGYWMLSDALGVANLGEARRMTVRKIVACLRGQPTVRARWPGWIATLVVGYGLLSTAFFVWLGATLMAPLHSLALTALASLGAALDAGARGDYAGAAGGMWNAVVPGAFVLFGIAFALRVAKSLIFWLRRRVGRSAPKIP